MDYVELVNMGLNQMKTVYDLYPSNVELTWKQKKTHCEIRGLQPSPQRGTEAISKSLKRAAGTKVP